MKADGFDRRGLDMAIEHHAADKQALLDLVFRYCRGIDRRDPDLLRTVYHPDAVDDHGGMFCGGVDEFIEQVPVHLEPFSVTTHMVGNALFDIDGNDAYGETYVLATHVPRDDPLNPIVVSGRYLDHFQRRDGEWRILKRSTVGDWTNIAGGMDPEGRKGQPDRTDCSYRIVPALVRSLTTRSR